MAEWDSAALERLEHVTGTPEVTDLLAVVRQQVGYVWRANLQRQEPAALGDTSQTLGWLSAVNIAQLLARRFPQRAQLEEEDRPGITAGLVGGALAIRTGNVITRLRKAPGTSLNPDLTALTWEESTGIGRHRAADANSRAYRPTHSDQDERLIPLEDGLWSLNDPDGLRNLMLVWAGDPETGLTAGWVGFPSAGAPSWFAVQSVWRDEPTQSGGVPVIPNRPTPVDDSFADRAAPTPVLRPRPRPGHEQRP